MIGLKNNRDMSTVEISWEGSDYDLDAALAEFMDYWSEQDIRIDSIEPAGGLNFWITVSSNNILKQHKALVEGTNNAEGLIDFLDDFGHVNNWNYI